MDFYIREMSVDDGKNVISIYAQAVEEGKSTFQTDCSTFEQWNASHLEFCRYVIFCGEKLVGWCALSPTSSRTAYSGVAEVSVYVDREFRGHGYGEALMRKLCEESEKMGIWCLYAAIFSINILSITLHKKCGFREVGYREKIAKDRFGFWQNTTILERRNGIK